MALWSRGFPRGSLFKTWPKLEIAHDKASGTQGRSSFTKAMLYEDRFETITLPESLCWSSLSKIPVPLLFLFLAVKWVEIKFMLWYRYHNKSFTKTSICWHYNIILTCSTFSRSICSRVCSDHREKTNIKTNRKLYWYIKYWKNTDSKQSFCQWSDILWRCLNVFHRRLILSVTWL